MSKNIIIGVICIGFIVVTYFFVSRSTTTAGPIIPTTSLEERICERVSAQFGDCKKILLYDSNSKIVFAENSLGIIPVLTNKEFTDFEKFILPMMDFQEFKEEKVERGPLDWRADNNVQKDLSVIYGFAEDPVKTIVIESEGNIQPNRFFVRDNLWVWYATFQKDKVKLPVEVRAYDANGQIIYGGNEKE